MTDINARALDRELKRGSAELLILSLLDARPRHGYDLSKLIRARSGGQLTFHIDSLYPLLYRLEERGWITGTWVEKPDERRRRMERMREQVRARDIFWWTETFLKAAKDENLGADDEVEQWRPTAPPGFFQTGTRALVSAAD